MTKKLYFCISATVFGVVGTMHLLRLVFGWQVMFGGVEIPLWVSLPALLCAGALTYHGWRLSQVKDEIGETGQQKNFDKLMEIFSNGQDVTNDVVQMLLGVSDATATRYLDRLEKDGKIVQIGKEGRFLKYRLK